MNKTRTNPGKVVPMPFPAVKTEPVARPAPGAFSLPKDVEKEVITYLEQKGAAKNDYDKALDFFLDLNSDFGVDTK